MLNQDNYEKLKNFLEGKEFKSLKVKNVISNDGSLINFFYFIEKNTSYVYQLYIRDNYLEIKKIINDSYKKYKSKEIEIMNNFIIKKIDKNPLNYSNITIKSLLTHENEELNNNKFNFNLEFNEDNLIYSSNESVEFHSLSYDNNEWSYCPFLSLMNNDKIYENNQLYLSSDKTGLPIYVKDKVYIISLKEKAIIQYNFIENSYYLKTDLGNLIKFSEYENDLILIERNKKDYSINKKQFNSIVNLYDYLIGDSKEYRKILKEIYKQHSFEDVYLNMLSFITEEIQSKNLILNYGKDYSFVTVKKYLKN